MIIEHCFIKGFNGGRVGKGISAQASQSFNSDNSGMYRTGLAETALSQLVNAMINPAGINANGKANATKRLKAQGFEGDSG